MGVKIMRERHYLLDRLKTNDLKASILAPQLGAERRRVWAWLRGANAIPETYFSKLVHITERLPSDLLSEKSLTFFANSSF